MSTEYTFCNYFKAINKLTTTPKRATPSIRAAAINIAVWILPLSEGWRAIDSTALLPIRPIPKPAANAATPAPIPAPANAIPSTKKTEFNIIVFIYY